MKKLLLVAFVATYSLNLYAQRIQTPEVEVENRTNTQVTGDFLLQAGEFQIIGNDPKIRLLESNGGDDFAFNVTNGRFRIQEIGASTVERFTINGGKVGIGTPSPGYKFQVGSGRASIAPSADQDADIYSTGGITMQGDKFLSLDDTYKVHANMTYEEGSDIVHPQGRFRLQGYYGFRFVTHESTEAMMIKGDNGFIGVRTISPAYRFQVGSGRASVAPNADQDADIYSTGGITMQGDKLLSLDDTYKVHANLTFEEGIDAIHPQGRFRLEGYYGFRFVTKNAYEAMMIKGDNGFVGINDTNPLARLHVDGSSGIRLTDDAASPDAYMMIKPSIDVSSLNPGVTTAGSQITNRYFGHLLLDIMANDDNDAFAIRTDADKNGVVDRIAMVVKPTGNVGIGTTSPNEKLHVAGKIRATGQEGWSDFVFYDDYVLPTLEEVESHIEEKGHLQDIPSEAEVLEEGIDLTEMDSKLLQKIEELTLYLIEQYKEIKDLKARLEQTEKALEEGSN